MRVRVGEGAEEHGRGERVEDTSTPIARSAGVRGSECRRGGGGVRTQLTRGVGRARGVGRVWTLMLGS